MTYRVRFTRQAEKDTAKLTPKPRSKLKDIFRNRLAVDPHSGKPLIGPVQGYYSMRLTYQDQIVYSIRDDMLLVVVVRAHPLWRLTGQFQSTRKQAARIDRLPAWAAPGPHLWSL